jgi:hypothetical protein
LVNDGFDINKVKEDIYIKDDHKKTYIKLDKTIFDSIMDKKYKL